MAPLALAFFDLICIVFGISFDSVTERPSHEDNPVVMNQISKMNSIQSVIVDLSIVRTSLYLILVRIAPFE